MTQNHVLSKIWTPVYHFWRKINYFWKKWKERQDLNLRSSDLKSNALPTELRSQVIERSNISLYSLIWLISEYKKGHQVYNLPRNHEVCIYAKSAQLNSVFCLDFGF